MPVSRVAGFFQHEGRHLYGSLYLPEVTEPVHVGFVLCPPFADEAVHAHRVLVDFAVRLAGEGMPALLFDYAGTGDSEGRFEDGSLESYARDIRGAMAYLRQRAGVRRCGLLGLRLGATLAARMDLSDAPPAALVLWSPILRCGEYFRGFLRSRLLTEVATLSRRTETVRTLEERLLRGEVVDVLGYGISGAMARSFLGHAPAARDLALAAPTLMVEVGPERVGDQPAGDAGRGASPAGTGRVTTRRVTDEAFWTRARVGHHDELFDATLEWLGPTVAALR
jgi:exosortase A-associated hydrolase 2